ncbi:carboxymuconolactone decarboxylase family protein [Saccharothrix xinjiangensis]|uniref:Carboxymuconolactone decarboxylase family protein n=1 Tax=Saccharothrix xinjiangensis TaxID=204798 RepID=A0ABV9Y0Q5_9PSEU
MARIPYPDVDRLPEHARVALGKMAAPLNLMRMCAHAPMLVKPLLSLSTTLLTRLALSARHRELLILRVARNTGCEYLHAQHRTMALALGLDEDEVDAAWRGQVPHEAFDDVENALLEAADALHRAAAAPPELVGFLDLRLGHERAVEVLVVVGHYRMLAGVLTSLAVDVDPQGEKFVALSGGRRPVAVGDEEAR